MFTAQGISHTTVIIFVKTKHIAITPFIFTCNAVSSVLFMLFTTPIPEGIHNSEISDDIPSVKATPSIPCHQENIPKPPSPCATLGNHTRVLLDRALLLQLLYGIKLFRDWQFIFSLVRQIHRWTHVICQFLFKLQSDKYSTITNLQLLFPVLKNFYYVRLSWPWGVAQNPLSTLGTTEHHIKHPTSGTALL